MTNEEIAAHMFKVLKEEFDVADEDLRLDASFEELGIDSIDAVDLIVQMKSIIGKRIPPENFKQVRTLADVVEVIASLKNE